MNKLSLSAATALAVVAMSGAAAARDQIRIVGSSTVYPYSLAVVEEFASMTLGSAAPRSVRRVDLDQGGRRSIPIF